jgi:ribonuclease P protein component
LAKKLEKLKIRADFVRVAAVRRGASAPGLVLQAAPRSSPGNRGEGIRVGFTASRKVGNAVSRNRAKRRLRAAAAIVLPSQGKSGTDYVLIARAGTAARPFSDLIADLQSALGRIERESARSSGYARDRSPPSSSPEGCGKTSISHESPDETH